jgi:predicted nucleic acid-binding protein
LPEADRDAALVWFGRWSVGEVLLIAPDLLLAEVASLLAKRHGRGQMSAGQAREGFALLSKCAPRLFETCPRLDRAMDLSLRYGISLWDSVYLALAVEHDCRLLTADARLVRAVEGGGPAVELLG